MTHHITVLPQKLEFLARDGGVLLKVLRAAGTTAWHIIAAPGPSRIPPASCSENFYLKTSRA